MDKKVIIIGRNFPAYRKAIFDSLNQKVRLLVLYTKNKSDIKSVNTSYSKTIAHWHYGKKENQVLLFPLREIIKHKPKIVICELALGILNLPIIMISCKIMKIKFAFWSHGYNRKTGFNPRISWSDKYRLMLLRATDAILIYGENDKIILQKYLDSEKIFVAQNTIDTTKLSSIRNRLEKQGIDFIKAKNNIIHKFNIIYISRMISSKKPELLIEIYELLKEKYHLDVGIHLVGDGQMLDIIKEKVNVKGYMKDFYFYGAVHDDNINGQLLFISDIMANPGDLGLSINYAFSFNCPVISFKKKNGYPAHGPEIDYLINNQTGFLVLPHTVEALSLTINNYLINSKLKAKIRQNVRHFADAEFPLSKMVDGILSCVTYLDKSKKKIV